MIRKRLSLFCMVLACVGFVGAGNRYSLNLDWLYHVGDFPGAETVKYSEKGWQSISLPRAFNEDEAYRLAIDELTDTVVWYRKHFRLPKEHRKGKVFVEFEGVRHGADFYLNGHHLGYHENGVMAVGLDLTPYINRKGDNVLAVRVDNSWGYRERTTHSTYQWNNKNFNANYGGIPKNVYLHLMGEVYQTLPLYSNLQTTGVYVYATDYDIPARKATIHVESEVRNESARVRTLMLESVVVDMEGREVAHMSSTPFTLQAGATTLVKVHAPAAGLHFWSWGYGYLYTVKSRVVEEGVVLDETTLRTGFRKTRFAEGKIWLNDRVLMMKGFAQRTSNEWPAVGMSVPAWLSDYSNGMMVQGNANLVRWMHVTPWKQDVESCDRVGLIQAMPAGDAEKDREGRQWEHRVELMRDAIIYNRNNPSILFYECGNESISREHMIEMKRVRDLYDPHGGRAIGSREMLDIDEAEYGGEMLYINTSAKHPMWAMEYCRDEGLRKYWDAQSYPYHPEGKGPLYRGKDASDYNHNQDRMAIEHIRRWYDYWRVRPGSGRRVSSGGVKIIFSDTNTHFRGESNYRTSGVTDAMRLPKDSYYAHQVMWNGWVDIEEHGCHIIGHWNYPEGTVKEVYVVSSADSVALLLNGMPVGKGKREYDFLYTFSDVAFVPGTLQAIGYTKERREVCTHTLHTAGEGVSLCLTLTTDPEGFHADGVDLALVEVEVLDSEGHRCPLDNRTIHFTLDGAAQWRGGIAQTEGNGILATDLPVECGVNRVLVRSTRKAGKVMLQADAEGLAPATISWESIPVVSKHGLSSYIAADHQPSLLLRGETPQTPSYTDFKRDIAVESIVAGSNQADAENSRDDNELSEWRSDGKRDNGWITYTLADSSVVDEVVIKLSGWRSRSYPLDIYADGKRVYSGDTDLSLGYVFLPLEPIKAKSITLSLRGAAIEGDGFGQITELAGGNAGNLDGFGEKSGTSANTLRIVEVNFVQRIR